MQRYQNEIQEFSAACKGSRQIDPFATAMQVQLLEWQSLNKDLFSSIGNRPGRVEAIAFDYLMYSGYIVLAYQWLRIAEAVIAKTNTHSDQFLFGKLAAARYCFSHVLPRAIPHREAIKLRGNIILKLGFPE